jgi:hypothetical protein
MIQLAVLPGPSTPEVIDSFLQPIVEEFKDLSNHGLLVRRNGVDICKAKVNLVIGTGDIPAAAALSRHAGHMGRYGCRICRTVTERHGSRTCFLQFNADIRNKTDFTDPDPANVSSNKTLMIQSTT